jgi:type VI secretion system protein ImpG
LLGSVLERFIARHVSLNSFTQLRLRSPGRGEIVAGPARCGSRAVL